MKAELQDKLYKKYPKIFVQKDMDKTQTAMCWGISYIAYLEVLLSFGFLL